MTKTTMRVLTMLQIMTVAGLIGAAIAFGLGILAETGAALAVSLPSILLAG